MTEADLPDWDLVHIIGIPWWRMPQMPFATQRSIELQQQLPLAATNG